MSEQPKRRRGYHNYTVGQKSQAVVVAVNHGTRKAADQLGIPRRTIDQWIRAAGGLAELRELARLSAEQSVFNAARALGEEIERKVALMSVEDLAAIFKELLKLQYAGQGEPGEGSTRAQAAVQVTIQGNAGTEVLDVPTDPPPPLLDRSPPGEGDEDALRT